MGELNLDEYRAVREGVGLIELKERGKIRASGPDRVSFLHNMISNDVEDLAEHAGRHSTFLTAQGKIVAAFHIYKFPEFLLLDLDSQVAGKTLETLNRYIIMDEVELADATAEWDHFSLQGPRSAETLSALVQIDLPGQHLQVSRGQWQSGPIWVIHKADLAESGFEILLAGGRGDGFRRAALESAKGLGLRLIGEPVRHVLRVEAGIPRQGAELDESRYPMEARLDGALDFKKGCYIGQEVVAKATYIGGVARRLVRVLLDGGQVPSPGAVLLDPDGKKAGSLTSTAFSPSLNRPIALGYVKKKYAQAGQPLTISVAQGDPLPAKVVERFV